MKLLRYIGLALLVVLMAGLAAPYVDATGYRERIRAALEQALHRKVAVGKVRFNLLTGPGFAVDNVVISEDPSIGIEPIAYVETLDARVRLTTLWTQSLSFSTLRMNNPTVNIAKGDNGVWNFQLFVHEASQANADRFPLIQVRSGRINFKIGDYKAIFYLSDADLDITPIAPDRLDMRFSGQPARTDHAAENFGRLLGRGVWRRSAAGAGEMDANFELERSGISELARLVQGHAVGVHGVAASRFRVTGPIDRLKVTGQLHLEDVHRWDLAPGKSGGWDLQFEGSSDLVAQTVELETDRKQNADAPFVVRFRLSEFLRDPKWSATIEVKDAPVAPFIEVARHMGAPLPEGFSADGKVAGVVGYARPGGVQGQFTLSESSIRLQNAPPLNIKEAAVVVDGEQVRVGPSTVALSGGQTAEVDAAYDGAAGALAVNVATREMNVSELRTGSGRLLGADAIPVLESCRQGVLRGTLAFRRDANASVWSGKFDLHNARIDVDGLAEPLRIASAHVEVDGPKLAVTQVKGRASTVAFTAEYRKDRGARPPRLTLDIPEADLASLEQAMLPMLRREAGLLARLRIRSQQAPEWLRARSLDATVSVGRLTIGEDVWTFSKARLLEDGATVRMTAIDAKSGDAVASGDITADLNGPLPRYTVEGTVEDLPYKGGALSVEGSAETIGAGDDVVANAHGSGTFSATDVTLPPEGEFRSISGAFEFTAGRKLKLTGVQATQPTETYTGAGATQPDGRTVLELTGAKRSVKVALAK